jgi:hypothetical protein
MATKRQAIAAPMRITAGRLPAMSWLVRDGPGGPERGAGGRGVAVIGVRPSLAGLSRF